MRHKKLKLKTVDGFSIAGVHTISEKKSVVLWLHGIAINKDEYLNLFKDGAEFMGESGYDSLRIDFRGHGESSGRSTEFSITGQLIDVDAAIKYLKGFYKTNLKIHLVGCSFGSPPSIFTAYFQPDIIKSITLIAPVLSYQRTFLKPETEWGKEIFNVKTIAKLYKTNKLYIGDDFSIGMRLYKEMQLIHPEVTIGELNRKVTIIHGDADSMVPYDVSNNLSKEFTNITFVSMKNMDHGFNDWEDEIGISSKSQINKQSIYSTIKKTVLNEGA